MREYQARAKLNLTLDVLHRRPDGYHALDGVMCAVSLADTLRFTPARARSVRFCGMDVPADNTVARAMAAYARQAGDPGLGGVVLVQKKIPAQAGLGGGSADAAAVLRAMQEAYGALSREALFEAALLVGADVPFCLLGGLARAQGIGERLTPLAACPAPLWFAIAKPRGGISTPALFSGLDCAALPHPDTAGAMAALQAGDLPRLGKCLGNALAPAAQALLPEIAQYCARLTALGALGAAMTGSGAAAFGLFESEKAAQRALAQGGFWWGAVARG